MRHGLGDDRGREKGERERRKEGNKGNGRIEGEERIGTMGKTAMIKAGREGGSTGGYA